MTQFNSISQGDRQECRWIVFDAVGTLIYPQPTVAEAYHVRALASGSKLSQSEIGERFRLAFRRSEAMNFGENSSSPGPYQSNADIEVARWRWIVNLVVPDVPDLERCFADLWDHFADPRSWACFSEVGPILEHLRQHGFRLAIASNFDSRLHGVCKGHPALHPIERRFVSSETGYRKPAREFYATMIEQLDCPPSQILMVGDDPEHDVVGPQESGMRALLLDRRQSRVSANTINSLQQLTQDRLRST